MKKLILALLLPLSLSAANHYVLASASGTGTGADWTNACTDFTGSCAVASLVRGDTYYVGDGTYAARTWSKAQSGTSVITILKATVSDHGTSTGWSNSFATTQSVWSGGNSITTGYWTFNGQTGSGTPTVSNLYGFKFDFVEGQTAMFFNSGGTTPNVTFQYVDFSGITTTGNHNYTASTKCLDGNNNPVNLLVSHCACHGVETGMQIAPTGATVEYTTFFNSRSTAAAFHGNIWFLSASSNIIFRYNTVYDYNAEGVFLTGFQGPVTNVTIYGNLFYGPPGTNTQFPRGVELRQDYNYSNVLIYNNTFAQLSDGNVNDLTVAPNSCTGCIGRNNLGYQTGSGFGFRNNWTTSNNTADNVNRYVNITGACFPDQTGGCTNPYDWHLSTNTSNGFTLPSPYNVDMDGITRGANGTWDLGTYQIPGVSPPTVTVTVPYIDNTQAVIHTTASGSGAPYACSYRACPGAGCTLGATSAVDVDPSVFSGSNSESRTVGPNSIADAIVNGANHWFPLGHRLTDQTTAGNWASRALQAATSYTVGASCGTAAEVTATFTTLTVALGESWQELPATDPRALWNLPVPTVDWTPGSGQGTPWIDPMTGVLNLRMTGPLNHLTSQQTQATMSYAEDLSAGGWTNVNNAITNQVATTLATTSTLNAKLFVSWALIDSVVASTWEGRSSVNDLRIRAYGYGPGGPTMSVCLTANSSAACNSGSIPFTLPAGSSSSSAAAVLVNSTYPTPMLNAWQPFITPQGQTTIANVPLAQGLRVNTGGTLNKTLTWQSGAITFSGDWPVGARVRINGSCLAHIAAPGASQLTMQIDTNCGALSGATFEYFGAGVLVSMTAGTTAHISLTYDDQAGGNHLGNSNAEYNTASFVPITDINTDRFGNPTSPAQTGYLMQLQPLSTGLSLFIPILTGSPSGIVAGENRLLSDYYNNNQGVSYVGYMSPTDEPFSDTDNKGLYIGGATNHVYQAELTLASAYPEFIPPSYPPIDSSMTYTDLTTTTTSIAAQLAALAGNPAFSEAAAAYATGLFGANGSFPGIAFDGAISGNIYYRSASGGDNHAAIVYVADQTNTLIQAYTTFTHYPTRWGGQHFSRLATGNNAYIATNDMDNFDGLVGGPWPLDIPAGMYHDGAGVAGSGTLVPSTFTVSAVTNASNPTFTSTGIALDPYFSAANFSACGTPSLTCGPRVVIAGGTGSWAAANGTWIANVASTSTVNTFSIPALNTTAFGAVAGTITVTAAPVLMNSQVTNITNASPPVVTTSTVVGSRTLGHGLLDGDSIEFSQYIGTQYFAHVLTSTTFSVFTDAGLTTPAVFSAISGAAQVHFAEMCPGGLPAIVTSGQYLDSGATGLRCIAVRAIDQPCDRWSTAAERVAYPAATGCPSGSASLQNLAVGDAVADTARNQGDEKFIVVKITSVGGGKFDLVLMRFYGNQWPGSLGNITNTSGGSHDTGWTPKAVVSQSITWGGFSGYVATTDSTNTATADSVISGCHSDIGWGWPQGSFSYSGCGIVGATSYNAVPNQTTFSGLMTALKTPATTFQNCPAFASNTANSLSCGTGETYSTVRTYFKQVPYKTDAHAMNPGAGSDIWGGSVMFSGVTPPSLVGGFSNTYLMTLADNAGTTVNIKLAPYEGWAAGRVFMPRGGNGYACDDANKDTITVVYLANECVSGSTPGQIYGTFTNTVLKNVDGSPVTVSLTNTYDIAVASVAPLNYYAGWLTQEQIVPIDTTATKIRRLTYGNYAPYLQPDYMTQYTDPTGTWNMYPCGPSNGWREDFCGYLSPPWPTNQTNITALQDFVNIPITVPALGGADHAQLLFGYTEFGGQFFCNQMRQENCSTDIPTQGGHTGDPYAFVTSDTHSHTSCAAGCTINIPAYSDHAVNYEIQYFNGSTLVSTVPGAIVMALPTFGPATAFSGVVRTGPTVQKGPAVQH